MPPPPSLFAVRRCSRSPRRPTPTSTSCPESPSRTISPEIYGHFIEHLGGVIYDGVWVGARLQDPQHQRHSHRPSSTPCGRPGPVLRWPGGCFADSYDWRDGLGPAAKRPARTGFWDQQDTNHYGLHEFMHTCRAIGCKPYLAADLRTLPARDFYQEIEYCNAPAGNVPSNSAAPAAPNALAAQRAANGDTEPFNVDLWGVGNESWGCGGNLTPEEYAAEFRRFTAWTPSYSQARLYASSPSAPTATTSTGPRRLFKRSTPTPSAATSGDSPSTTTPPAAPRKFAAGDALKFNADELLRSAHPRQHHGARSSPTTGPPSATTARTDQPTASSSSSTSGARGTARAPSSRPQYNLSQQSTMRDALLTGITLDIFQRHADKVAVANVAQSINCIHSLMLAQGDKFTVTPTFHVFQMYLPHRGAQAVRAEFTAPAISQPARQRAHSRSAATATPARSKP